MKENDDKLTLQETEQLCRMYMDCTLSVFEETELRYILDREDYHSELIDDVRGIMHIDAVMADKPVINTGSCRKNQLRKRIFTMSIAASIALIIGIWFTLHNSPSAESIESPSYYIAYVEGQRLSDKEARSQIEAKIRSVDDFIKEMSELEESEQHLIDNFFNL